MDNSDELYDSLEEDFDSKCNEIDVTRSVPLYNGEKPLDVIKSQFSSKIPVRKPYRNGRNGAKKQSRYAPKTTVDLLELRQQHTYVGIFYAKRANFNKGNVLNDTARSVIGDFTERSDLSDVSSSVTEFSDARSSCSDTASFYFDIIKKMESGSVENEKLSTTRSSTVDFNNLRSVSEFSVVSTVKSSKRSKVTATDLAVPKLGGLGPDLEKTQEKLSKFQKQRSYGQKASDQNRIKILEIKVLKELKDEIKSSKS